MKPLIQTTTKRGQLGITLMEALIALVIVSLGMLGIAKLQGEMMAGSAYTKARAEAIQLAEAKAEELRNLAREQQYVDLAGDTEPAKGTNANFTVTWGVGIQSDPSRTGITVTVTWVDRLGATQTVSLPTTIAWDDPSTEILAALMRGTSSFVQTPKGIAQVGGSNNYAGSLPAGSKLNDDGTQTYVDLETGVTELIDSSTGEVLLTLPGTAGNTPRSFAIVAGTVYFTPGKNDTETQETMNNTYVVISDAGFCSRVFNASGTTPSMAYRCYISDGWYGNIGIVNYSDNVCVGDPASQITGQSTSSHPQLSILRSYRGFYDSGQLDASGIPILVSTGIAENTLNTTYSGHDFFLTKLTGQASCLSMMQDYGHSFANNTGRLICLTPDSVSAQPDVCPGLWPTGTTPPVQTYPRYIWGEILAGAGFDDDTPFDLSQTRVITSAGLECRISRPDDPLPIIDPPIIDPDPIDRTKNMYLCEVFDIGNGWTGWVAVDSDWGVCPDEPAQHNFVALETNAGGRDLTLCAIAPATGPTTIAGNIFLNTPTGGSGNAGKVTNVSINDGTCTRTSGGNNDWTGYSCSTSAWTGSWNGIITVQTAPNNVLCATGASGPGIIDSSAGTISFGGIRSSSVSQTFTVVKNTCPAN